MEIINQNIRQLILFVNSLPLHFFIGLNMFVVPQV